MEFFAIRHHAWLRGLRRLNAVACDGCGRFGCGCGCCGYDSDADVYFGPQTGAVVADGGVPCDKFGERNLFVVDDLGATNTLGDPVEFIAVCDHSWGGAIPLLALVIVVLALVIVVLVAGIDVVEVTLFPAPELTGVGMACGTDDEITTGMLDVEIDDVTGREEDIAGVVVPGTVAGSSTASTQ